MFRPGLDSLLNIPILYDEDCQEYEECTKNARSYIKHCEEYENTFFKLEYGHLKKRRIFVVLYKLHTKLLA